MFLRRRAKTTPTPSPSAAVTAEGSDGSEPASQAVLTVDDANFFEETAGGHTIVDFWAPWCAPCRTFAPIFQATARDHAGGVRFGSCNVDENPKTASLLGIMSIPTLVVFGPDGSEVGRHVGTLPQRALEQLVDQLESSS